MGLCPSKTGCKDKKKYLINKVIHRPYWRVIVTLGRFLDLMVTVTGPGPV